mmetsp:Transcript_38490/g.90029  ORF Transcript_38490/g.90029 Transcript_38490/m.90029 type:complete len:128 (-) Transcript_38490:391-774(-)
MWRVGCKWRRGERRTFEAALHAYQRHLQQYGQEVWESEVDMYVGPGDGGTARALLRHLSALLYDRTVGSALDLRELRRLQQHLRQLGLDVPIVEISMEWPKSLQMWDAERTTPIELTEPPYRMRLVE